jgi:hypothetical protein
MTTIPAFKTKTCGCKEGEAVGNNIEEDAELLFSSPPAVANTRPLCPCCSYCINTLERRLELGAGKQSLQWVVGRATETTGGGDVPIFRKCPVAVQPLRRIRPCQSREGVM